MNRPPEERLTRALARFDEENGRDPFRDVVDGVPTPRELAFASRLTDWVRRLCPQPSETLELAARCQHLCRWMIPRQRYPMTRAGYLNWREDLKVFHAHKAGEILREVGYDDQTVTRVQALNRKTHFPDDPESRILEDALCLVFLQFQLGELSMRTADDKVINALKKSWKKMTERARAFALELPFGPNELDLLRRAGILPQEGLQF